MSLAGIPVVIFAGGRGARFDHESQVRPKPMIEVAGKPILQHIIDGFLTQGFREFIVLTGYLHLEIEAHFGRLGEGDPEVPYLYHCIGVSGEPHTARAVYTGDDSHTGMRLWLARDVIGDRRFVLTYGDGLSDVEMSEVMALHERTGALVTMTAIRPPGRFGVIKFPWDDSTDSRVEFFGEKPLAAWVNGGFMVVDPEFVRHPLYGGLEFESEALPKLAWNSGLHAYHHHGYWRCMDTRRDLEQIEDDVRGAAGRLPWFRTKT